MRDVRPGEPDSPKDIMRKTEPWRRGYFQTLLGIARQAEHLEGFVRDTTRDPDLPAAGRHRAVEPAPQANRRRLQSAPREENCELCYAGPAETYDRLLGTVA